MRPLLWLASLTLAGHPLAFNQGPDDPPACGADSECPGEQLCEAGVCVDPAAPAAGCNSDAECKGDRICVDRSCQSPTAVTQPPPPGVPGSEMSTTPVMPPSPPPHNGWALAGGITGLALTIPAFFVTIGSEVTREDQIPSLPLGAVATVLIAAGVPIAFAGAQSARRGAGVRGGQGLLITGWVFYGLAISNAIGLIAMGVSDISPPPGIISLTGVLGLVSGVTMSVGAFVAHKQATHEVRMHSPQLSFGVSPLRHGDQTVGGTLGLVGRF
jgi:hypothetical protein